MDDCIKCVPGGGVSVVEQLTLSEMTDIAWSWYEHANELSRIVEWLLSLCERTRLGGSTKMTLIDQLRRLHQLESNIYHSGNKLFINLMFNRDQENSREEEPAQ